MREILFRGKRTEDGKWIEGYLVRVNDRYFISDVDATFGMNGEIFDCHCVDPDTVGQYTGFVDKFMRKIYEGDIIKTKFGRECVVEWFSSPAYRGWYLRIIDSSANSNIPSPTLYDLYANYNLEIVNNIHDFPKELKEVVK